ERRTLPFLPRLPPDARGFPVQVNAGRIRSDARLHVQCNVASAGRTRSDDELANVRTYSRPVSSPPQGRRSRSAMRPTQGRAAWYAAARIRSPRSSSLRVRPGLQAALRGVYALASAWALGSSIVLGLGDSGQTIRKPQASTLTPLGSCVCGASW